LQEVEGRLAIPSGGLAGGHCQLSIRFGTATGFFKENFSVLVFLKVSPPPLCTKINPGTSQKIRGHNKCKSSIQQRGLSYRFYYQQVLY
jgi:hypothetical protein